MSRKDSFIHASGAGQAQEAYETTTLYCSECTEKFLSWRPFDITHPRYIQSFHRDLFQLMDCGTRCTICDYICGLFGRPHLDRFLSRAREHNEKADEPLEPDAANRIISYKDNIASQLSRSRASKRLPTVVVEQNVDISWQDKSGPRGYVAIRVILQHHVAGIENRRSFDVCTAAGRAFHRTIWSEAPCVDLKARCATIREWLTECQTRHPDCQKTLSTDTALAAHILAVQEHKAGHYTIKLVSTESVDLHNEPYLVLSHVWGGIDIPCKTTSRNIASYYDTGVEYSSLPATFQDAIRLTTAIGFQYIWIDSMCIIQDDTEDWQRESAKMAAIFRAGTITLSATSSANSHGGCGLDVAWGPTTRFRGSGEEGLDFAFRESVPFEKDSTRITRNQLRDGPVNERAWILQEKLLSRRILHATRSQFVWQCGKFMETEDGTMYQEKEDPFGARWTNLHSQIPDTLDPRSFFGVFEVDVRWWSWVGDYTRRSLTFPSDQYVAIAGIVQLHQYISNDVPIVGLWRRNLVFHLAWDVRRELHKNKTTLPHACPRRPSWTWMSYPHGSVIVVFPHFEWNRLTKDSAAGDLGIVYQAEILHTNVKWSGEPLTSEPSGSTIRIRGVLRRMPPPPPVGNAFRGPLQLDPGVSALERNKEYEVLALVAYVHSAVLVTLPPYQTTVYLVVEATGSEDKDEYVRVGRMNLTENVQLGEHDMYRPKGVLRDITLV